MDLRGDKSGFRRAQSAMEYLMTYGWAILVIAVVLAALFALGVFNGGSLGTACVAQSGFLCKISVLSAASGNLIVTVGQATGSTWYSANVAFLNSTLVSSANTAAFYTATSNSVALGTLQSGTSQQINLPIVQSVSSVGTSITGQLWARYTTSSGGATFYYTEIGVVTAKSS